MGNVVETLVDIDNSSAHTVVVADHEALGATYLIAIYRCLLCTGGCAGAGGKHQCILQIR